MFDLQLTWNDALVTLDRYYTREDAEWAATQWREQFGRPADQGNPFRVVEVAAAGSQPVDLPQGGYSSARKRLAELEPH